MEAIILEEDFNPVNSRKRTKSEKQDKQPRDRKEERDRKARSMSCDFQYETSGNISCLVAFVSYGFTQQ